jgi:hypothetical protein
LNGKTDRKTTENSSEFPINAITIRKTFPVSESFWGENLMNKEKFFQFFIAMKKIRIL